MYWSKWPVLIEGIDMDITLFATLFVIGSMIASLLTEAIKKAFENAGKQCAPNLVALLMAIIVGIAGAIAACILLDIAFNAKTIVCIAMLALAMWTGSMVGYDKVRQLICQIWSQ